MLDHVLWDQKAEKAWDNFVANEQLSEHQATQFRKYAHMLSSWNERANLTRISTIPDIIAYHFQDSLRILDYASIEDGQTICDIGSGGGFPGIPCKIMRPGVSVVLVEVNQKKGAFLQAVIDELGLTNIDVCLLDLRTFLRQATEPIEWFFARASLQLDELVRMFRPACRYRTGKLVYWASQKWRMGKVEEPFFYKEESYLVNNIVRRYIFFKLPDHG